MTVLRSALLRLSIWGSQGVSHRESWNYSFMVTQWISGNGKETQLSWCCADSVQTISHSASRPCHHFAQKTRTVFSLIWHVYICINSLNIIVMGPMKTHKCTLQEPSICLHAWSTSREIWPQNWTFLYHPASNCFRSLYLGIKPQHPGKLHLVQTSWANVTSHVAICCPGM